MTYTLVVPKVVQKQLDNLPDDIFYRINEAMQVLTENPRPPGSIKLKGSQNEYRIRIGDYRVRYTINDKEAIIVLLNCKHRKDIYIN